MRRTAICFTSFSRRFRISAPMLRRQLRQSHPSAARSGRRRAQRVAGAFTAVCPHLRHRLGRRRLESRRIRRARALLREHGVDLVDCSSGGNVADAKIPASRPDTRSALPPGSAAKPASPRPRLGSSPNRRRPTRSSPRARPILCSWPAPSCAIPIGRCTPRRRWAKP
jgi:hypothetical protein